MPRAKKTTAAAAMTSASPQPTTAPMYYASMMQIGRSGNDISMTFIQPRPGLMPDGSPSLQAFGEAVAVIHVSIATAKDLAEVMAELIRNYEKEFGTVETDFTRRRAAEAKTKRSRH